jgi:hypothetical protein
MMVNPALNRRLLRFSRRYRRIFPKRRSHRYRISTGHTFEKAVEINHNDSHQEKMNVKEDDA